jgi:hypothetical protein
MLTWVIVIGLPCPFELRSVNDDEEWSGTEYGSLFSVFFVMEEILAILYR